MLDAQFNLTLTVTVLIAALLPAKIYNTPDLSYSSSPLYFLTKTHDSVSSLLVRKNEIINEIQCLDKKLGSNRRKISTATLQAFRKIEDTPTLTLLLSQSLSFRDLEKLNLKRQLFKTAIKNKFRESHEVLSKRQTAQLEISEIESRLKRLIGHPEQLAIYDYKHSTILGWKDMIAKISSYFQSFKTKQFDSLARTFPTQRMTLPVLGSIAKLPGEPFPKGSVPWAGIIINSAPGAPVKAVGSGEVVFASDFNTLKNLVILDHGKNFLTLYGNLEKLEVKTGMSVLTGQEIGIAPSKAPNQAGGIYFEIREHGEPIDPKIWFKY